MNAIRPIVMHPERTITHTAWRLLSSGESHPLGQIEADTPEEAALTVARFSGRGHVVHILTHDTVTGKRTLRLYQIKHRTNAPRRFCTMTQRIVTDDAAYPALLAAMQVTDFAPTEPWKWTPGCDVVGVDRTLIEGNAA